MKPGQLVPALLPALLCAPAGYHAASAAASPPRSPQQAPLTGPPRGEKDNRQQQYPYLFSNPPEEDGAAEGSTTLRIPTSYESAVMGRRILALTPLATLSTVFPAPPYEPPRWEHRPPDVADSPVGLMEYIADCEGAGDPTMLAVLIAPPFQNIRDLRHPNASLSLQWTPLYAPESRIELTDADVEQKGKGNGEREVVGEEEDSRGAGSWFTSMLGYVGLERSRRSHHHHKGHKHHKHHRHGRKDPAPYSAANLPRFSLQGYLEDIPLSNSSSPDSGVTAAAATPVDEKNLTACFLAAHPDSRFWLPGTGVHTVRWMRLVVEQVYWIGGFGGRSYIGWIPVDEWRRVSRAEWEAVRLPGEEPGWEEEPIGAAGEGYRAGSPGWAEDL